MPTMLTRSFSCALREASVLSVLVLALCISASAQTAKPKAPARSIIPVAKQLGGGYYRLAEFYTDGTLARRPIGKLKHVKFLPIKLATTNEMARGHSDRALIDPFEEFADGIFLPDGSRIYRVKSSTAGQGFLRISREGRFQILAWTTASSGFKEEVAISNHNPYMAMVGDGSLPEYGGNWLVLARTDGKFITGTSTRAIGVATPMLHDVKAKSLCFLTDALFGNDGDDLYRIDLTSRAVTPVTFPLSNNNVPVYVDTTCAAAANGSVLAIGAGDSLTLHDVYTVNAAGVAVNQTEWAHKYLPARNADDDGMLMALSPEGERLAYVLDNYYPYAYTMDLKVAGTTELFTGADFFPCFIDTIVGLGFATKKTVVFSAGSDFDQLDAYSLSRDLSVTPEPGQFPVIHAPEMQNLTKTSSTPQLPFLIDSTLSLESRFTAGPNTYLTHEHANGDVDLQAVNGEGDSLGLVSEGVSAVVALDGLTVIVDENVDDKLRIQGRVTHGDPVLVSSFVGAEDEELVSKAVCKDGTQACFLVEVDNAQRMITVTKAGYLSHHTLQGWTADSVTMDEHGMLHFLTRNTTDTDVRTFDPSTETWQLPVKIPAPVVLIP